MKSSALTFGLGIIAAAGSVMIGASAEAATLLFANGPSITGGKFEFEFIPPTDGSIRSKLFVTDTSKTAVVQNLFTEPESNNGTVTPGGVVESDASWAATAGTYILGWGNAYAPPGSTPVVGIPSYGVYSNDPLPNFKLISSVGGWYTYGIEDIALTGGDLDYNDGKFRVRAVPVPAIVPGIALAGAFFGSKALKRNKKNAEGSVA